MFSHLNELELNLSSFAVSGIFSTSQSFVKSLSFPAAIII